MTKKNYDGIIEAVRFARNGQIDMVRAYERRGDTFSDCLLLDRKTLIGRLKTKKRFIIGQRTKFMASTFDNTREVQLVGQDGAQFISTHASASHDELEGAPLF